MKKKINWRRQIIGNGIVLAVLALLVGFVWYRTTHAQDTWRQMTADKTVVVGWMTRLCQWASVTSLVSWLVMMLI